MSENVSAKHYCLLCVDVASGIITGELKLTDWKMQDGNMARRL